MFGFKKALTVSFIQFAVVLILHFLYSYIFQKGRPVVVAIYGIVFLGVAITAFCFIKKEIYSLRICYACIILAVFFIGCELSTIVYMFNMFMGAAIFLAYFMMPKRVEEYWVATDIVAIFVMVIKKEMIFEHCPYPVFIIMFFAYNLFMVALLLITKALEEYFKKLEEKTEEAVLANESKSQFLANVSHEIRTPMNVINGMVELILREKTTKTVKEYGYGIQSAARTLLSIINDVLDLSKIESGKEELFESEYRLNNLVLEIITSTMMRMDKESSVDFFLNCQETLPEHLYGDDIRIKQILTNLITNAIKYTDKGHICLDIHGQVEQDMVLLTFCVTDTGIGIRKEDQKHLFESFQQVDKEKNRGVEGTGLGLTIVKHLVEMMKGSVRVESNYGEGSSFIVTLPQRIVKNNVLVAVERPEQKKLLVCTTDNFARTQYIHMATQLGVMVKGIESIEQIREIEKNSMLGVTHIFVDRDMFVENEQVFDQVDDKIKIILICDKTYNVNVYKDYISVQKPLVIFQMAAILNEKELYGIYAEVEESSPSFAAPNLRVLIVDDNEMNLKVTEGLLKKYKIQADTAYSGYEAVEMVKQENYNLIFMDHMMPMMDGIETTNEIRLLGNTYCRIPIIALTANAFSGAREDFLQKGMNDFLSKPVRTAELEKMLQKWIPKELVVKTKEEKYPEEEIPEEKNIVFSLLNLSAGVEFCGDDKKMYRELLLVYCEEYKQKRRQLLEYYEKKDYKNFIVEIHGIKSSLKMLGFEGIATFARGLERAASAKDYSYIDTALNEFLELYEKTTTEAQAYINYFEQIAQ